MSFSKFILGLILTAGVHATAYATDPPPVGSENGPQLLPHRGVWKNYLPEPWLPQDSVPENSVAAYQNATFHPLKGTGNLAHMVEIDIRMANNSQNNQREVIVYHDFQWDKLTDKDGYSTQNWGHKLYYGNAPLNDLHDIDTDPVDYGSFKLRWWGPNGFTVNSDENVLSLDDYIQATVCDEMAKGNNAQDVVKLLLDVQNVELATAASAVIRNGTCDTGLTPYHELVYMKLFAGSTIHPDIVDDFVSGEISAFEIPGRLIEFYDPEITYVIQVNSGQLEQGCSKTGSQNCSIKSKGTNGNALIDTNKFVEGALQHSSVMGLSISKNPHHLTNGSDITNKNNTIENLYNTYVFPRYNNKIYMSVGSRPDDVIKRTVSKQGNNSTPSCFPYNYNAKVDAISFFAPGVYNGRNLFAKREKFHYIILDGYMDVGSDNVVKVDYDLTNELQVLCNRADGNEIVYYFRIRSGHSPSYYEAGYRSMHDYDTTSYRNIGRVGVNNTQAIDGLYD